MLSEEQESITPLYTCPDIIIIIKMMITYKKTRDAPDSCILAQA